MWTYEIWKNSERVAILGKATNRYFTLELNRPGSAGFTLNAFDDIADPEIITPGVSELRINKDGTYFFGGQFLTPTIVGDRDDVNIQISAIGYLALLQKRYISSAATQSFSSTDAGEIAWTLIDDSQNLTNGDFGITEGTIEATQNRDRNYKTDQCIYDELIQLTEVINGIDIEITHDKVFNVYDKKGSKKPGIRLLYPGGNIFSWRFVQDSYQIANQAIVRGSGFGEAQIRSIRDNTTSQGIYKLRQKLMEFPSVVLETTLEEKGDEELRSYAVPAKTLDITIDGAKQPTIGNFLLGDEVFVKIQGGNYSSIEEFYRIVKIDVNIDDDDNEQITLGLQK